MFSNLTNVTSNMTSTVSGWLPASLKKGEEGKKSEEGSEETAVSKDAEPAPAVEPVLPVEPVAAPPPQESGDFSIPPGEAGAEEGAASAAYLQAAQAGLEGVTNTATNAYQSAKTSAMTFGQGFGSFLYNAASKAGKQVTDTATKIKHTVEETSFLGEFNREQDEFAKSQNPSSEPGVPPWVGYPEEDILQQQILGLSQDRRNFVRSPPSGVEFQFDYNTMYPIALATLKEDPNLEQMRFELVPKVVNEETFWKNYFYRVSLIKQSTQLSSLAQEAGSGAEDSSKSASRNSSIDESPKEEAWERELQQELQEYEVVNNGDNSTAADAGEDADWEKEVQQMLGS